MSGDGFSKDIHFRPTQEIYGVDPKELAEMSYKDAAIIMYVHSKRMYEDACDRYFSLPINKEHYNESVSLSLEMEKYLKASKLASVKLNEIGIDSSKINWRTE